VTAVGNTCLYNGSPCVGSGSATGVLNDPLTPMTLIYAGTSYGPSSTAPSNAGSYTVTASFGGNTNYKSGTPAQAPLTINQAASTTTVTGGTFVYDGLPHPATVSVSGAGMLSLTPSPTYGGGSCSSAPITVAQGSSCTASYTYSGDLNHTSSSGNDTVVITPATAVDLTTLTRNGVPPPTVFNVTGLRLTNDGSQTTSAWRSTSQPVASGFSTSFSFQITPVGTDTTIADGFAFVIQADLGGSAALGTTGMGGYLGYTGLTNSIAIEFDTYPNGGLDDVIPHIAIQSNGIFANSADHGTLARLDGPVQATFADGAVHTATVKYDGTTLRVYIDGLATPIVTATVNLDTLLGLGGGNAFVGFTGATGAARENSDILTWNWN
jgi:hypothetical protein